MNTMIRVWEVKWGAVSTTLIVTGRITGMP